MTYYPDPERYQQLGNGDPNGPFDCTAWSGAYAVDAHTEGTTRTTGTAIRSHSSEPKPDPKSPGLNLPQVDEAILTITHGKVDLDTRIRYPIGVAQNRIEDGRYAILQVNRGVLVDAGYGGGSSFRGGHAIVVSFRTGAPVIFDPLVRHVQRATWGPIWRAAGALASFIGYGYANVAFTRDVTPDWLVRMPAGTRFSSFIVKAGTITARKRNKTPNGFAALCTPPYWVAWPGHGRQKVVTLTSGSRAGDVIRAKWAQEINR